MRSLVEVENLTKRYGGVVVNDDITLSIAQGEIFGLLGPNGAGKTTLVQQIVGIRVPTSGQIRIDGVDIVRHPAYARDVCSFEPQGLTPIAGLRADEAIQLVGEIRGGSRAEVRKRAAQLIAALQMEEWASKPAARLSGGALRLTAFCMAAVQPGRLVVLDEPTNDIDPLRRRLLWDAVRGLSAGGAAVLLVTHNVLEAERAVDRLAIIHGGRVVESGSPREIKQGLGDSLRLELQRDPNQALPALPDSVTDVVELGRRTVGRVSADRVGQVVAWANSAVQNGVAEEFLIGPSTLEDAYLRLVDKPAPLDEAVV